MEEVGEDNMCKQPQGELFGMNADPIKFETVQDLMFTLTVNSGVDRNLILTSQLDFRRPRI